MTGNIYLPTVNPTTNSFGIFSGGNGTGSNGNIMFIAGASGGTSIVTGPINAYGGIGGGGIVNIVTAAPVILGPGTISPEGVLNGAFDWTTRTSGIAELGTINSAAALNVAAGEIVLNGDLQIHNPGAINSITLVSADDIRANNANAIQTLGGNVLMSAGADFTNAGGINVTGPSATGGSIDLSAAKFISTADPATGLSGGAIALNAYKGAAPNSGNIVAPSLLSGAGNINILANGNVGFAGSPWSIAGITVNTPVVQSNGAKVFIVAGADYSQPLAGSPAVFSLTGGTANGGSIDLSNTQYLSTAAKTAGGDLTIAAFAGTDPLSGHIVANSIYTGADMLATSGTDSNGNVKLIAGANGAYAVNVNGIINAGNVSPVGGAVNIAAANPVIEGAPVFIDANGQLSGGALTWHTLSGGSVSVNDVNSASSLIIAANDIRLTGGIAINDIAPAHDYLALLATHDIVSSNSTSYIQTAGGDIMLVAGGNYANSGDIISVIGPSATGGKILLANTKFLSSAFVTPAIANGNGGNITAVAFADPAGAQGTIELPLTPDQTQSLGVFSGGKGTGTNGNIIVIAGGAIGITINAGDISSMGGTGGGGDITVATATPVVNAVKVSNAGTIGKFTAGTLQSEATVNIEKICCAGTLDLEVGKYTGGASGTVGNIKLVTTEISTDLIAPFGYISVSSPSDLLVDSGILISAQTDVSLTAADTLKVGSEDSGLHPVIITAGTLSAQGVNDVAGLYDGTYVKNYIPRSDIAHPGTISLTSTGGNISILRVFGPACGWI